MADGVFDDPLMLKSEHKRILGSAQERGDDHAKAEYKRGYWSGIAQTIWITGIALAFVASGAFSLGAGLPQ